MDTLKQFFAFPIYASAAWLLWVLAQQTSSIGLGAALAGAVLIALAAWAYQKSKSGSTGGRVAALVTASLAVLLAFVLPMRFAEVAAASPGVPAGSAHASDEWQPYDAAQVAALTAAGRPLLVNFTASWCLTCLVNERNAFADSAVQEVFRNKNVTLMKGDWTNRDPHITQALAAFGRAGVPLYVVYNSRPGSSEPVILPQLLTAAIVQGAFADTPTATAAR
jgi:thiol:disulfide interchange protein